MNKRLGESISKWLDDYKKNSVKSATYDRLVISNRLMNKYSIVNLNVAELSSDDIQRYLNELVSDGYSLSTIKKQFTLLTAYLKYAFSIGKITNPIYLGVRLPGECAVKKEAKTVETYNHSDQRKLMKVLSTLEHPEYGAIVLMLECGLRCGEAQCLSWNDILWNRSAIRVNKTLVRSSSEHGSTFVQNGAKSRTSNRTIPVNKTVIDILESLEKKRRPSDRFIFPSKDDSSLPISYSAVKYYLRKACGVAGIKYRSPHSLRHTFASNCYERGCDVKILSKLLGHADVTITYNIYIHLYGDALEEMRKVLG